MSEGGLTAKLALQTIFTTIVVLLIIIIYNNNIAIDN